ncbi:thiamine pyrophosphate-dependent enzyme [Candidatus Puniceispirillum sp.]|nr:thiamine pyrophosphate-dependent enzyme [Candidatus Puniceispirillum sp.]
MPDQVTIDRREAVEHLLKNRGDMLVVCGLGSSTYDVFAAGDHHANFYLWGAMGGAIMIGLGLAIAEPNRQVMVITGDGEALMGLGSFASAAAQKPNNLSIVILDNEHFGETGMQKSHTSHGVDLAGVATGCGFNSSQTIYDYDALNAFARLRNKLNGPRLAVIKITTKNPPRALPKVDGIYIKTRLRQWLGHQPC